MRFGAQRMRCWDALPAQPGRYRYAKAVQMSANVSAVLTAAPRYENAAMILDMRGLREACQAPLLELSFDHDWDETAWARLRSFLYYCR